MRDERGQEAQENYINGFSENKIILGKWVILDLRMMWLHNCRSHPWENILSKCLKKRHQ